MQEGGKDGGGRRKQEGGRGRREGRELTLSSGSSFPTKMRVSEFSMVMPRVSRSLRWGGSQLGQAAPTSSAHFSQEEILRDCCWPSLAMI